MSDGIKQGIINKLNESGFPMELKTQAIFNKHNWLVDASGSYNDYDHSKIREIDLFADKTFYLKGNKIRLTINLIVEVKSVTPNIHWVIAMTKNYGLPPNQLMEMANYAKNIIYNGEVEEIINHESARGLGTSFKVISTENVSNNVMKEERVKIYNALTQACKAAFYMHKTDVPLTISGYTMDDYSILELFMPLVVADTRLFEAFLKKDNTIDVEEVNCIPISFPYRSKEYENYTFGPSIVTFNYLDTYLNDLEKKANEILSKMLENKEYYIRTRNL